MSTVVWRWLLGIDEVIGMSNLGLDVEVALAALDGQPLTQVLLLSNTFVGIQRFAMVFDRPSAIAIRELNNHTLGLAMS